MHANNTSINDHTPTFAENQDCLNVDQCLNGISDFLLYTSTLKLDQSNHLTNYFLEDKQASKNFSNSVNDIEFSELIRSCRLHRYYNKLNQLNNSVIVESHHQKKALSSNRQSQPQVVIKIMGTSPPKFENKKYSQIESRYSPKNLKFYLKQEQQSTDSQISQSRRISQSVHQSRSSSFTMSSITSNFKFQQVYQNQKRQKPGPKNYQFCLLSQKHQELTKLKQKNEPNKMLNLSLNSLSSKIEKNK
ncbi:unnamed protein product [Paramecium octaurelia]|uniref:Uncharacterized protein n=1 Tax=Paramecium octaurelia TaxID=43137 RepID=A0A8S1SEN7_PAROT|nr:unnamed protein product [Paramecium octaurelia]